MRQWEKKKRSSLKGTDALEAVKLDRFLPWANLDELFPPEILLPSQLGRRRLWTKEHHLLVGVLAQAFNDAEDGHPRSNSGIAARRRNEEREEARWWFAVSEPQQPFAFDWICHALNWEPDYIRRLIIQTGWPKDWRLFFRGQAEMEAA